MLGADAATAPSLAGLSPGLLAAFLVYFTLGFGLYAAMYAGAGSLLSRAEDLQTIALPLSIPAIMGYFPAVLALSGGSSAFIKFASYVPLWSPFVMMAQALDRPGRAMGARALDRPARDHGAADDDPRDPGLPGRACCSTASRRRSALFVRTLRG